MFGEGARGWGGVGGISGDCLQNLYRKHQNQEHKHLSLNGVLSGTFVAAFLLSAAEAGSLEVNCTICISNKTISFGVLGLKILQRGDEQQLNNSADVSRGNEHCFNQTSSPCVTNRMVQNMMATAAAAAAAPVI